MRGARRGGLLLAAAAALCAPAAEAFGAAPKFLIVSAPSMGKISYVQLPEDGRPLVLSGGDPKATSLLARGSSKGTANATSRARNATNSTKATTAASNETGASDVSTTSAPASASARSLGASSMEDLVTEGLTFPQGVAVDQVRKVVYVADPNLGKLVSYPLKGNRGKLSVGAQKTVAENVEVRAVAVDGLGNVFFTEEPTGKVMRVTAKMIEEGSTTAETVYAAAESKGVSAPGGIAVDNYFVYWLNKVGGSEHGTVLRGRQTPAPLALLNVTKMQANASKAAMVALASNAMKCYGVCLALGNIFYTAESTHLYGVHRASTAQSNPVTVADSLEQPRGCAFDGDSTVYVADKVANAVYQFPSNMQDLTERTPLTKAADLPGAFGVAVYVQVED